MRNLFKKRSQNHNKITVETFHGQTESIEKKSIDFVLFYKPVVSSDEELLWLKLGSFRVPAVTIPIEKRSELQKIEPFLFGLKNFDRQAYNNIMSTQTIAGKSKILWVRPITKNYKLPEKPFNQRALKDYEKGLYREDKQKWIPWKDYATLESDDEVATGKQKFPNPDYHAKRYTLKNLTLFGGLQLEELFTETDPARGKLKFQLPVIQYRSVLKLPKPEENLAEIADHLSKHFQQDAEKDKTSKKLEYRWSAKNLQLKLYCFFREELKMYDRTAYLKIEHQPDVSAFYASTYLKNDFELQNCDVLSLELKMNLNSNYREVDNAAFTPEILQNYFSEEVDLVFWQDTKYNRFCIADAEYCLIFKMAQIKKLVLTIEIERGREGRNRLQIELKNGKSQNVGRVDNTDAFNDEIPKLNRELPFPVTSRYGG